MQIKLTSVFVNNQDTALQFYTDVLGFAKKTDISMGKYKFITVTDPNEPEGTQLLLEPNENPAALTFQQAIYEQGIAAAAFLVDDITAEYERLLQLGVKFKTAPTAAGGVTLAVFDDTCGNWIQIYQMNNLA